MRLFSKSFAFNLSALKYLKMLICCILLLFFSPSLLAQQPNIDSLITEIKHLPDDSIKINALNEVSLSLWDTDPDTAIYYASKAMKIGNEINYPSGVAYAAKNIGMGYYSKGDYIKVLEYWQQSLAIFNSMQDANGISNILMIIGAVYSNQGDDAKAIEFNLKSLQVAEEIGNKLRIASAYVNIGNIYLNKAETHDKSLDYSMRGLKLSEELGMYDAIGNASVNIGEIYYLRNNYDSALFYFEKALKASEIDGNSNVPYSLNSIGKVHTNRGNYVSAVRSHNQALQIAQETDDVLQMAQSLIGIGNAYRISKRFKMSMEPYLKAENHALKVETLKELQEIYEGLSISNSKLGDYTQAFNYQTLLTEINYALYNAENDKKIQSLQFTYDIENKQKEIEVLVKDKKLQDLEIQQQEFVLYAAVFTGFLLILLFGGLFNRFKFIRRTNRIIEREKERSDELLLNILPEETAEELKENGTAKARSYDMVTILFTDFKGFTALSATLSPQALVKEIHHCYKAFDEIMAKYKVEKIKTIGDAYMAAGGLPIANKTHPFDVTHAAIEIREFMNKLKEERTLSGKPYFEIRIGIHSGPVVAGVVGTHKFAYDIWGDAVNIASRMESNSEPGKINISESTYDLIKDQFECSPRGKIAVKGAGEKSMYFIENRLSAQLVE